MQQNFLWIVEQAVQKAGLKPCDLRLEITETALMDSPNVAAKLLRELREFGVKIYLDDFGTGYSSLSHLHKLPVDALKIDRSFVKSLLLPDRPAIVESILALARTLNTSVVAEGIEERRAGARAGAPRVHARPGLPLLASAVDRSGRGNARRQPAARPEESPAIRTPLPRTGTSLQSTNRQHASNGRRISRRCPSRFLDHELIDDSRHAVGVAREAHGALPLLIRFDDSCQGDDRARRIDIDRSRFHVIVEHHLRLDLGGQGALLRPLRVW